MADLKPQHLARNRPTADTRRGDDWRDQASCRDESVDPEWWYSPKAHERALATQICAGCPVQTQCAELGAREQWGIWAGEDKTRQPKPPTCAGGCGKNLRPRGTGISEHPGTVLDYANGYCSGCWKIHGPGIIERRRPPATCTACQRPMRPGRTLAPDHPGTVEHQGRGICKSCYKQQRRNQK